MLIRCTGDKLINTEHCVLIQRVCPDGDSWGLEAIIKTDKADYREEWLLVNLNKDTATYAINAIVNALFSGETIIDLKHLVNQQN